MAFHHELSLDERIQIRAYQENGLGPSAIGRAINRHKSTVSRELRRLTGYASGYEVMQAHSQAQTRRCKARVKRKLAAPAGWTEVKSQLLAGWSPEQIARRLREEPSPEFRVSHETIYKAIYLVPRGELRKDLIGCLRQGRSTRKPRTRGHDRRGVIPDMQSIHIRPPEVEKRQVPGHWEGDLIKGAGNRSSIGTLVERTTGYVVLAKMSSASAEDALTAFSAALERIPPHLRKTMTYDQGREMSYHAALTLRTGVAIYFADPHAPWQRGTNENTNGLLRQYLPKGTDLSVYSQDDLNKISLSLNTRPRKRLKWRTPLEVYTELIALNEAATGAMH